MAYKALYRTYRPQRFEDVVGQDVIVKTLQNALNTGKITHAYLFSGPRGTGKTTIARLLAKSINCSCGMSSHPCNECTSCKEIMEGISPDVIEIDAASNNGVDEIREIKEKVKFLPGESKYKIYIIDEVHMLTTSAFNALLKTLEEPPKHVIFILATTEPQKVLPTILSRCQRYDFKSLTVNEISKYLVKVAQNEKIRITDEAVNALAENAEGGMRDALSLLDQAISLSDDEVTIDDVNSVTGNLSYNKIIELANYFEKKNISSALKVVNELLDMGKEVNKIVVSMLQFYRDILLFKNVDINEYKKYIFQKDEFKQLANVIDEKKIYYYVDILSETQNKLRFVTSPHIFLEVAIIKMMNVSSNELDLIEKVKELQTKIDNLEVPTSLVSGDIGVSSEVSSKVNLLEDKVNRIVSELGKLELQKLVQRVNVVEELTNDETNNNSYKELEKDFDKIKEDVYLIKANFSALQNQKPVEVSSVDNSYIDKKLLEIEKNIKKVEENSDINYDKINDIITDRIKDARHEVRLDYDKIVKLVDERTSQIDAANKTIDNTNKNSDNSDILLRLENIEEKVYKIMSGALAMQPTPTRRNRNTVSENQIVLFGDDMVTVGNIEKHAVKERFDFEELTKEEVKKENRVKEENLFTVMKEEEKPEETETIVFEKTILPKESKKEKETPKEENVFGESKYDMTTPAENILNRSVEGLSTPGDKEESKVDVFGYSKYDMATPAEKSLNKSLEKLTDEYNKPKSQLVIRKNGEDKIVSNTQELFSGEKEELKRELNNYHSPEIIAKEEPKVVENSELDEFESYDVRVIERILNDSRKEEAKNDKNRIMGLWKVLAEKTPEDRRGIAEVLQEGTVVAVGNREFIIIYRNASMCSQVMKRKFKRESLKLLFDFLGNTYNYMALPENIWLQKRAEYVNQYNIGAKNIRLEPLNDMVIKALMSDNELTPEEEMLEKAQKLFGDDIIEFKE